jgi:hypothetical protein
MLILIYKIINYISKKIAIDQIIKNMIVLIL